SGLFDSLIRWSMRRQRSREEWARYFMVRKGVDERIRQTIGLLNSKVGYVFLLDGECRIRWAGCGDALPEEKEYLVRGLRRLVEEAKGGRKRVEKPKEEVEDVEEELEAQAVSAGAS
ncbi:hypothetical protein LTS18_011364, partial [Coniosporium uncinatum]